MRTRAAEALGTFALVLFACGAIAVDGRTGALGHDWAVAPPAGIEPATHRLEGGCSIH